MKFTDFVLAATLGAASITGVNGFFRMPCSQPVVVERGDPIVSAGAVSGHVHTIMGGNAFNFTETYDTARTSTCSSCKAKKDASNYWIPHLFYHAQNGSFHPVTQNGGALIYYLQRYSPDSTDLTPFPPGFRMLAGDASKRSYNSSDLTQQAISWVCLNYAGQSPQTPAIPNNNCPDGLRSQVFFPSCWDGVNLDTPNHKDHVAYPDHMDSGTCPPSHPVRLVSLFYEVIWNINDYAQDWWSSDGHHPFVLAMGDPTGYGHHGDFLNGWDEDALATAINQCTSDSGVIEDCGASLELWTDDEVAQCRMPSQVDEVTTGWLDTLPGCNAIQAGPGAAVMGGSCGKSTPALLSKDQVGFIKKDIPKWDGIGCAQDSLNARVFPSKTTDPAQTIEKCVATCLSQNYNYAGLEWGVECWCGNSFDTSKIIPDGNCVQPCAGDSTEMCGNGQVLSVYHYNPNKVNTSSPPAPPSNPTTTAATTGTTSVNGVSLSIIAGTTAPNPPSNTAQTGPPVNVGDAVTTTTITSQAVVVANQGTTPSTSVTTTTTSTGTQAAITSNPTGGHAPQGWVYRGCYVDTVYPLRTLPGDGMWYAEPMTPQVCTDHCTSKGFIISGTEYSGECYCGNTFNGSVVQKSEAECNMPCKGDGTIMCGGAARMSVYSRDMRALKRDVEEIQVRHDDAPIEARSDLSNLTNVVRSPSAAYRNHRRGLHGRSRLSIN